MGKSITFDSIEAYDDILGEIDDLGNEVPSINSLIAFFNAKPVFTDQKSAYNYLELIDGFTVDTTSKVWGGSGEYYHKPSKINRRKLRVVPDEKAVAEKIKPIFQALWYKLADKPERSLSDMRDIVEGYAFSYRQGYDPLTGERLEGEDFKKAIEPAKSAVPPIGETRNAVLPDEVNMILLKSLICDREFIRAVDDL